MKLVSWMYVSRSLLPPDRTDEELHRIVSLSHLRNREQAVTGALVFTGTRFAQYVEGPDGYLTSLQRSILADPRHTEIVALDEKVRDTRCFERWSLAFAGSSWRYVAKVVERPLEIASDGRRNGVDALRRLMVEFVNQSRD